MRTTGRVASFTVNKKHISVRVEIPTTEGVEELRKYKGKTKTVSLEGFKIHAAIDSLALGKNLSFLLHAPKRSFVARKLFLLMEKETMDIVVSTDFEDKLLYFLDTVAAKRTVNAADLLYELFLQEGRGPHRSRQEIGVRSLRIPGQGDHGQALGPAAGGLPCLRP